MSTNSNLISNLIVGVFSLLIIALIVLAILGINNLDNRTTDCEQKNGVMVKTVEGWRCIETRII